MKKKKKESQKTDALHPVLKYGILAILIVAVIIAVYNTNKSKTEKEEPVTEEQVTTTVTETPILDPDEEEEATHERTSFVTVKDPDEILTGLLPIELAASEINQFVTDQAIMATKAECFLHSGFDEASQSDLLYFELNDQEHTVLKGIYIQAADQLVVVEETSQREEILSAQQTVPEEASTETRAETTQTSETATTNNTTAASAPAPASEPQTPDDGSANNQADSVSYHPVRIYDVPEDVANYMGDNVENFISELSAYLQSRGIQATEAEYLGNFEADGLSCKFEIIVRDANKTTVQVSYQNGTFKFTR